MAKRRVHECWIGAACEYCGLRWERGTVGKLLRFDMADDAIVCERGFGCARRRPEHERVMVKRGIERRQYLLDGHWYSETQLADLAELSRQCVGKRLEAGWTVADALLPVYDRGHLSRSSDYKRLCSLALRRAGGAPAKVNPTVVRGRPRKYGESITALAQRFGKAPATIYKRILSHGYDAAIRRLLAETQTANDAQEVAA